MTKNQVESISDSNSMAVANSLYTVHDYIKDNPNYFFDKIIPLIDLIETYQGEGPNCGKKMVLARFKYCNKSCPFCDTQKMMKDLNVQMYSLHDISMLLKHSPNLMITGGEPTLNIKHDNNVMSQLDFTKLMIYSLNYQFVDIETNGYSLIHLVDSLSTYQYYAPKCEINISWSPKFVSKNDYSYNLDTLKQLMCTEDKYIEDNNIKTFYSKKIYPIIKIVISDDLPEYKRFIYEAVLKYRFNPNRVYLMPEGTNLEEINKSMESVLKVAFDLGCNVSSRLHIIHNFK